MNILIGTKLLPRQQQALFYPPTHYKIGKETCT
jgi:hypothetical protein